MIQEQHTRKTAPPFSFSSKSMSGSERMKKILIAFLLLFLAVAIGFLTAYNYKFGVGFAGAVLVACITFLCMINAEAGLYVNLAYSFLISYLDRLLFTGEFTEGVGSDFFVAATFFGLIIKRVPLGKTFNELLKSPIFILLFLVYLYTALEFFNPNAGTFNGWVPAIRKVVANFMIVIIAFHAFTSRESILRFIKVLFVFCLIAGIYGCIQEWHDFFDFEMDWLRAENQRYAMTYVNGGARRISTFPDALSFAILMAVCGAFFTGIGVLYKKPAVKIVLAIGVVFMLMGMSFALTRTSNVMFIGGMSFFFLLTFDKPISKFAAVSGILLFLLILFGPFYNSHVGQFRHTFLGGTKDASYLVREVNRKKIQPYIYQHPFGGGMNTSGDEGKLYSPGHRLAGFPPDSGMLKKALEMGWIGFTMVVLMYFFVLKAGIKGYFEATSEGNKIIYASTTAGIFALYLGDFSQVAIGQITDVMVYYPFLIILIKLNKLTAPESAKPI